MGKPEGTGGPWLNSLVAAGEVSDPYLMTGYDRKKLQSRSSDPVSITVEVDITRTGDWQEYRVFELKAEEQVIYEFPWAFQAYWIRFRSDSPALITAQLTYQ